MVEYTPAPASAPELLTIDEAVVMTSISRSAFYARVMPHVRRGAIRSVRLGTKPLIYRDSLAQWLDGESDIQARQRRGRH